MTDTSDRGDPEARIDPSMSAGRRVVVTGGARGIGRRIVEAFVEQGARVAVIDRLCSPTSASPGATVIDVDADLGDAAAAALATRRAIGALDGVDVLVNNAGVFAIAPLLEITPEDWDRMFAVNVRAMLVTTQVAAQDMIAAGRGGRIVNMASMGGKVGAAGQAHYAASKAAVISLTQVSALELGPHGITVNAIAPGIVPTDMGADTRTAEQVADWTAASPLGRLGRPDDIASMALFLASPGASYCTGQTFNVSGGMIFH